MPLAHTRSTSGFASSVLRQSLSREGVSAASHISVGLLLIRYSTAPSMSAAGTMVDPQPARKEWEPTQVQLKEPVDLRFAGTAPRGYRINPIRSRKRTREEIEALANPEQPEDMVIDEEAAADDAPKRQRLDAEVFRKVSGKTWKAPAVKAGSHKSAILGTSWEKKMADKRARQLFSEQKQAAVTAAKDKRKAAAQQRAAAKERKKQNQAKSAVVQKITNSATVKKLMKSKKQRKLLRTADTN